MVADKVSVLWKVPLDTHETAPLNEGNDISDILEKPEVLHEECQR